MVHAACLLLALLATSGAEAKSLPILRANKFEKATQNPETVAAASQAFADHVALKQTKIAELKSRVVAKHAAGLKAAAMDETAKGSRRALSSVESSTGAYYYQEQYSSTNCDGSPDYLFVELEQATGKTGCLANSQSIPQIYDDASSGLIYCNADTSGGYVYGLSATCGGDPIASFSDPANYDTCVPESNANATKYMCGTPSSKYQSIGLTVYVGSEVATSCDSYNNYAASLALSDQCETFMTNYSVQYGCNSDGITVSYFDGLDCNPETLLNSTSLMDQASDECTLEEAIEVGLYVTSKVTCSANYFSQSGGGGGSSDDDVCFSGDSTVELESGEHKTMQELVVGDRVLTADAKGELSFSDVVFLPHGPNNKDATFVQLTLSEGQALKATSKHLLRTCGGSLAAAGDLDIGACLETKSGTATVASKTYVTTTTGIYTAVTNNEFLVVDGVVASPFAISHAVPHAFYYIHRVLYAAVPSVLKSPLAATANALFGSMALGLYWSAAPTLK